MASSRTGLEGGAPGERIDPVVHPSEKPASYSGSFAYFELSHPPSDKAARAPAKAKTTRIFCVSVQQPSTTD
jgi:hypothetical protein